MRFKLTLVVALCLVFSACGGGGGGSAAGGGGAASSSNASETITPFTINSISPSTVPASGGTEVTLTGAGFQDGMSVVIGGMNCNPVVFVSSSQVKCTTNSHALGIAGIVMTRADARVASLNNAMTFNCAAAPVDGFAVWANDGADKITRDEQRGICNPNGRASDVWSGTNVTLSGAKNEVVAFNLVLEASAAKNNVSVSFSQLTGPGGATISSVPVTGNGVFDWTQRNIELFYVRYLKIDGLSQNSYNTYDERHVPRRLQRPFVGQGFGEGIWSDRPDHDKYYPDIAVPLELVPTFNIAANTNQSIWTDIYIPKTATPGIYNGTVTVSINGVPARSIPVSLNVRSFALPDSPSSKTMLFLGYENVSWRYFNVNVPTDDPVKGPLLDTICDRHFQLAHRHKLTMIDSNQGYTTWSQSNPRPQWLDRLSGNLFKPAAGYDGPGVGVGNEIYSIGTYGSWNWSGGTQSDMWTNTNAWAQWFADRLFNTELFLYLIDESSNYAQTQTWASWMKANPGIGKNIKSFATVQLPDAFSSLPALDAFASRLAVDDTSLWQSSVDALKAAPGNKSFMAYNGYRPASGSFAIEDDGVALEELAWGQYKKGVNRWFFWQSTYYEDYQNQRGPAGTWHTDLFNDAQTFGKTPAFNASLGMTSDLHSNGDGVLFYPGTDLVFPQDSYGVNGPLASLRLKYWRRGIQDVDYITLAAAKNPAATEAIVSRMVPKVLWENGRDPGNFVRTDVSWSVKAADWAAARAELAAIIEGP